MADPLVDRIETEGARLRQGGRVRSLERIAKLTDAELNLTLRRFGIGQDRVEMVAQAVERSMQRLVGTTAPTPALLQQVLDRTESAVRKELRLAAKELTRTYLHQKLGTKPGDLEEWQAVMDTRTCDDCEERDGMDPMTHEEWEAQGLPGSTNLVCDGECRCMLVPARMFQDTEQIEVIVRLDDGSSSAEMG